MKSTSTGFAPFGRLFWKEYRAVRGFWIALVALVVLIQLITITFSQDSRDSMGLIYNFALGAPAFFAIGCAGAAFAMEQEEGTFEFLHAGPVTSRQVFISKLALAFCATLAMFCLLVPIAMWFMRGQLPDVPVFSGMLGLWLVAALEAIAWGTLFSLLTVRPLLAICLAIAATSTAAHLLAWTKATGPLSDLSYAPYLQAAPWRLLVAGFVFSVDVYLGLRWLHGSNEICRPRKSSVRVIPRKSWESTTTATETSVARFATKPDRSAMLGHLLWQHVRQSGWLMAIMAGLTFIAILVSRMTYFLPSRILHNALSSGQRNAIPMVILAALMGCCVFLADQEKRRYRFFVEHNVPPRYVWLTRQLPWLIVASLASIYFCWTWIPDSTWKELVRELQISTNYWLLDDTRHDWRPFIQLPPIVATLSCAMAAYTAGQWASMIVRSGLMAAFCGLLLACVLCGWVLLMDAMQVSFWWSVWPIPLVLLFATWLRAPDWIRENTRWSARFRAATVLLIPAAALLVAVPNHRVHEIPLVAPGFDPEKYISEITPDALATGELYRRANDVYVPLYTDRAETGENLHPGLFPTDDRAFDEREAIWLDENTEALSLMLEAAKRTACCLQNPQTVADSVGLRNSDGLIDLVIASGRQLELQGRLVEAMERYFTALRIVSQWAAYATSNGANFREDAARRILEEFPGWAARKTQTFEQIDSALQKLRAIDANLLRQDDGVKSNYIVTRRYLTGDGRARSAFYDIYGDNKSVEDNLLWSRLMSWENERALRMLNLLTDTALHRFRTVRHAIDIDVDAGIVTYLSPKYTWYPGNPAAYFEVAYGAGRYRQLHEIVGWFNTTNPNMRSIGAAGIEAVHMLSAFEAQRRGTMLVLALQAYRLEHGKLPSLLSDLVGPNFHKLPHDPYSGKEFVYFPEGIRPPDDAMEAANLKDRISLLRGDPGIWCTGPELEIQTWTDADQKDEQTGELVPGAKVACYTYRVPGHEGRRLSSYEAWSRAMWFPIPDHQK